VARDMCPGLLPLRPVTLDNVFIKTVSGVPLIIGQRSIIGKIVFLYKEENIVKNIVKNHGKTPPVAVRGSCPRSVSTCRISRSSCVR